MTSTLSAPGGRFVLLTPMNPARCPVCGEMVKRIWHYTTSTGDFSTVVGCSSCAGSEEER